MYTEILHINLCEMGYPLRHSEWLLHELFGGKGFAGHGNSTQECKWWRGERLGKTRLPLNSFLLSERERKGERERRKREREREREMGERGRKARWREMRRERELGRE